MSNKNIAESFASINPSVTAKSIDGGGLQISVANLRGMTQLDKARWVVAVHDALEASGIPANCLSVQMTYKAKDGSVREWPCVWVNDAPKASKAPSVLAVAVPRVEVSTPSTILTQNPLF